MLKPYPLGSPPPLPPFDGEWREGGGAAWGRRVRPTAAGFDFPGAARVTDLRVTGAGERRVAALEEPCLVWEVAGAGALELSCHVDLGSADLRFERSADGDRLWLGTESHPGECLVGALEGTLAVEAEGGGVRLTARGSGTLRLLLLASTSAEDRDRSLRILARRGFGGLQEQRRRHADQLRGLALATTTPEVEADRALAERVVALDAAIVEEDGRRTTPDLVPTGTGLLAAGLREQVRDLLRAPFVGTDHLRLYTRYAAWVGDDEFLRKRWPEAARALGAWASERPEGGLAAELLPLAELVGDLGSIGILDGIEARAGEATDGTGDALDGALERWGIVPLALDGMVRLSPALPAGWDRMTLERLRVGRTTLDLRLKRRAGGVALHVRVTHGPRIFLQVTPLLPFVPAGILVGDQQLPGPALRTEVEQELDAVWLA
jgi:hypothetical protein